ncbi:exodeoxyribonuclease V subunit gamma [Propionibacterium cyclohexanicum]|nr:exodeoxyribonuclease V subunit gamma [Propionibacterium cyclohexanicum]
MVISVQPGQSSGIHVHECPDWPSLCTQVSAHLAAATHDPFDQPLLVVPRAAQRRLLRQWIAADQGVCAGIEMIGISGLRARLETTVLGLDRRADPWSGQGLTAHLAAVMGEARGEDWFALVQRHLDEPLPRPGRLVGTARRVAALFGDYSHHLPQMMLSWERGDFVDATGRPLEPQDRWQPELFGMLVARLGQWPHPARRLELLTTRIHAGTVDDALPNSLGVLGDRGFAHDEIDLLRAVSTRLPVPVWQLGRPPSATRRCALASRYGRLRDDAWAQWAGCGALTDVSPPSQAESSTLLGQLQRDVSDDLPPAFGRIPDDSIQFHLSHGPDRQVEVLRELLCGLFDADPTLQPRDVVVACADLQRYAPLLEAHLGGDTNAGLHPGHVLRVRLTIGHDESNPARDLLLGLLTAPDRRASAADLVAIAAIPLVARRFGLDENDLARVPALLARAEVRWGIDAAQRARAGLPTVRQGTWVTGLDRLLAGLVLADSPLARLDTVVPVEHVDASDAPIIGALAELVSRIRMHLLRCATPANVTQWRLRLDEAMADLTEPTAAQQWQVNQVSTRLAELAQACPQNTPLLDRIEFAELLAGPLPERHRPAVFGSGDLVVCEMRELGQLSHRVVCLLGVGDDPAAAYSTVAGDDLLARPGVTSSRPQRSAAARQDLLDAILGARERVLVVGAGGDPFTGQTLPQPVVVSDLLDATGVLRAARRWVDPLAAGQPRHDEVLEPTAGLLHWHPLQPHSPYNFTARKAELPFSFDNQALAGAQALTRPRTTTPSDPVWLVRAAGVPGSEEPVDVDDLARFYQDPASAWFRNTFGYLPAQPDEPLAVDLPITASALDRYTLGTRMLESLLAGEQLEAVTAATLLSGSAPPGPLGQQLVGSLLSDVQSMAGVIADLQIDRAEIDLAISVSSGRVRGQLARFGDALVTHRYGQIRAKHLVDAWVHLVCASAQSPAVHRAVVVGRDAIHTLRAPGRQEALELLDELLLVRRAGLGSLLPLPPQAAFRQARCLPDGDVRDWEVAREFTQETKFSVLWTEFLPLGWEQLSALPPHQGDPLDAAASRFANLACWLYLPLVQHWQSAPLTAGPR